MSKKDKKAKMRKAFRKRQEQKKDILRERAIEEDCIDALDPERRREYLLAAFKRLEEYNVNIRRDPSDPLWEPSSKEVF